MKIIGIGGTNGSGKGVIAQFLVDTYGFYYASATEMFNFELKKRGLPTDRKHKSELSAEWRRQYGMSAIVDRGYEHYAANPDKYKGLVVESLRHPGEADRIHELGGTVVWADADPKVRYERIQKNAAARGRAVEDDKTYQEFLDDEKREMTPEGDGATLNMSAVKERADVTVFNNGSDLVEFEQKIEKALDLTA